MSDYDVIIAGSGLAGLTAGLFSARHGLSTLVLESNIPGGHLISIEKVEDFPGFPEGIAGYDLCPNLQRQAADQGAEFQRAEVQNLHPEGPFWSVITDEERHRAKAVIVATGSSLKELGIPGEAKFMGHGVSHCASCDGPLYNDKIVGVVGGGDSALEEALTLANYAASVLVFTREENFDGQFSYVQRALSESRIVARHCMAVEEILGDDVVSGVRVRDLARNETFRVDLAGLFVYVGLKPNTTFLKSTVHLSICKSSLSCDYRNRGVDST